MKTTLGYPYLDPAALADTDPATPGVQYDCVAEDVVGAMVTELAPCGPGASATCWSVVEDPQACPGR